MEWLGYLSTARCQIGEDGDFWEGMLNSDPHADAEKTQTAN